MNSVYFNGIGVVRYEMMMLAYIKELQFIKYFLNFIFSKVSYQLTRCSFVD